MVRHFQFPAIAACAGLVLGAAIAFADDAPADNPAKPAPVANTPKIQLVLLLDTSNSMDGLINQARTQLWKVVNELATAQRQGVSPDLQVALYEYGKDSLTKESGFIRQISPFTDDLDKISEELFSLTTNGGQEYCGQVIAAATRDLAWSESDDDLKLIFIAGNEPFTQGTTSPKEACTAAITKGITVSTIFCGAEAEGIRTGWQEGARLADGTFLSIDQNQAVAEIKTPFDAELSKLSEEVGQTYVAYGNAKRRRELQNRAAEQDAKAATAAPAAASGRAQFKASGKYFSAERDLVRAIADGETKLTDIKETDLPEELQKLAPEKREAYLQEKSTERTKLQQRIKELSRKRDEDIASQRRADAKADPDNTFDAAVLRALHEQAARKQYQLSAPTDQPADE